MKVLIDTNVLFSAALFRHSVPYYAFAKAVSAPYYGVVCDKNIEELKRIFNRKASDKIETLNRFLATALFILEIVPTPEIAITEESKIRDVEDRPILRAALNAQVDVLLTGDKDFLESGITSLRILSPTEFLAYDGQSDAS